MMPAEGRQRVVIENVRPEIDGGRFAARRVVGENVRVSADVFADGHDQVRARLLLIEPGGTRWHAIPARQAGGDRFEAAFRADRLGDYRYTIEGWIDPFASWQADLQKKIDAGQDVSVELEIGAALIRDALGHGRSAPRRLLKRILARFEEMAMEGRQRLLLDEEAGATMALVSNRRLTTRYRPELRISVAPPKALFSTWYERFPRSCADHDGRHGTFQDCIRLLPDIEEMGFDVLYLPPIHPIGSTHRKGRDNRPIAGEDDVGSPWAIGNIEGGHTAIHPALGTLEDFRKLVAAGREHGIDIALDIAFQCSPDHPWVREHPKWFRWRPDGTVQYAENPPKKYEDVLPLNFETDDWKELWTALREIILFWIENGVRIFRVDNPHTKPFGFWEWLLRSVKATYPDTIFLSEAFARPSVMYRLARIGFDLSYTYFTWRNTKAEFESYLSELTSGDKRDYFRPSFWPNTPDILPENLQYGGRPASMMRLLLAATLSASYGIYGPVFELVENAAVPGREEYQASEKYEIRRWDWKRPGHLRDFIARVNRIRRENTALQTTYNLRFLDIDNETLLAYMKRDGESGNVLLIVVNLDSYHTQSGWLRVPIGDLGIEPDKPYLVHDLLGDGRYIWQGETNYVEIDPRIAPGHVFRLKKRLHRESDFDYFL